MRPSILILAAVALVVAASACTTGASPSLVASSFPSGQASPGSVSPSRAPSPSPSPSLQASPASPIPMSCFGGDNLFTEDARGPRGNLVDIVRRTIGGVEAGDLFEIGRDEVGFTVVRITRDGQEIGTLWYDQDPDGGWLLSQWSICAGLTVS